MERSGGTRNDGTHRQPHVRFSLGRTMITATANQHLTNPEVLVALARHVLGDWGDVDDEDWEAIGLSLP